MQVSASKGVFLRGAESVKDGRRETGERGRADGRVYMRVREEKRGRTQAQRRRRRRCRRGARANLDSISHASSPPLSLRHSYVLRHQGRVRARTWSDAYSVYVR